MCKCTNVVLYSVLCGLVSQLARICHLGGYRAHAPRAPLGLNDMGGNVCIVGQHTHWVPGIAPRACLHEAGAVSIETGVWTVCTCAARASWGHKITIGACRWERVGRSSGHEAPISNPLCGRLGHVTGRSQTQYEVWVTLQVSII